jgi:hypothetical protein
MLAAIWLGKLVNQRLHRETFFNYIYLGLMCIGARSR